MIVEIRNYKTIKHVKFEFSGFASIVGQNFIGKSAVVGAIVAALSNSMAKTSIRDGEDFVEVSFSRGDLDLFWHYEEGNTYYVINGQEYKKLSGGLPPPLVAAGYAPISVADEKEYLWYIPQFQPLFVVDRDRSNLSTDLLATIFKFDSVYKALDLCKKEMREVSATAKLREADLVASKDALDPILPLEGLLPGVADMSALVASVQSLSSEVSQLDSWMGAISTGKATLSKLLPINGVRDVQTEDCDSMASEVAGLEALSKSLSAAASAYKKLAPVKALPSVPDTTALEDLSKELSALCTLSARRQQAQKDVDALAGASAIPVVGDAANIDALLSDLLKVTSMNSDLGTSAKVVQKLKGVSSLPVVDESVILAISSLQVEMSAISGYISSMKAAGTEVEDSKKSLMAVTEEYDKLFEQLAIYKSCPACGQSLEHEVPHV